MRPQGARPKFGGQGNHRPNSSHHNSPRPQCPRPPCPKSPRLSRGNRNANRNGRMFAPYGPMMGPTGPITGPNVPMMGPGMTPSGPNMRPNLPMMGHNGRMMTPNRPTMRPNGPMGCPGFVDPSGCNGMRPAYGTPPPRGPPMLPNGSFPQNCNGSPHQLTSKAESVYSGVGDKGDKNETGQCNTPSNNGGFNYNYPQYGAAPGVNCGWPVNTFPPAWNFDCPPNQIYYQNSNQNMDFQFSNQDYSQGYFYNNYDQGSSQAYGENYDQYYNQGQTCMPNNYYNVKQEDVNPNFNQNGTKNKKKNEKFQKMRIHYCDTCDRSLPSEEALATHISEHKVCGLDDCKFTAHPRVVEKHQQMQHFTGLYRRIGSLYTPEDIEKWRKARKKNYPTAENIQERRAKQEEMYARGERMGGPYNRGPRQHVQRNGRFQQRPNSRPNHQTNNGDSQDIQKTPANQPAQPPRKWKPIFPPVALVIEENEVRSGVKPFPGTAALLPKNAGFSAKDDAPKPVEKVSIPSALSFLNQYGDSSSEDDSDTEEPPNDSTVSQVPTEENCPSEPSIAETNPSHLEINVDSLQAKTETSDKSPTVVVFEPSVDSVCVEEKIGNECSSANTNELPTQPQLDTEPEDGEIQDSPTRNAEDQEEATSLESAEPSSRASISQSPSCSPSKENPPTKETESKIVSAESFQKDCVVEEKSSLETESRISEETKSEAFTSNKTVLLSQSDKEMSNSTNGHDCSDDSGPEEVPIVKDEGDKEGDGDEENDEVISGGGGGGGRKRRRQTRQPNKKLKVEENQTNEQQHQPHNKNAQRHENRVVPRTHPPVRRAPTLLEKLLSKEICHERNVILQCVRYVVENKFFRNERK